MFCLFILSRHRLRTIMGIDLRRYDRFAWAYEYFNSLSAEKISWFLKFARQTDGPILELACGTGRMMTILARDGFEIDGIDLSDGMLAIAETNLSTLDKNIRRRINIHKMNICDFHLERRYALVYLADNSFLELGSREEQWRLLGCARRHLLPDGIFLMVVRRHDEKKYENGIRIVPESKSIRNPTTGESITRRVEWKIDRGKKSVLGTMHYEITAPDGRKSGESFSLVTPILSTDDYFSMLAEAGFAAEVFVDYKEPGDDGKSPFLCFVARPTG